MFSKCQLWRKKMHGCNNEPWSYLSNHRILSLEAWTMGRRLTGTKQKMTHGILNGGSQDKIRHWKWGAGTLTDGRSTFTDCHFATRTQDNISIEWHLLWYNFWECNNNTGCPPPPPPKKKTEQSIRFFRTCSDQQLSFPHYNNTKIIKFGWELFILWVISYGLSFSGFARFPEFRGTIP